MSIGWEKWAYYIILIIIIISLYGDEVEMKLHDIDFTREC